MRYRRSETDHDGFQQQSPQQLGDRYKHMDSQNERLVMRLKAIEVEYYSIEKIKSYGKFFVFCSTTILDSEWSVAPSIFNIKAWGLAHCLL